MIRRYDTGLSRLRLLAAAVGCAAAPVLAPPPRAVAAINDDDAVTAVERSIGRTPTRSDRIRLTMPPVFPNGYTVPLSLDVLSPMTDADHVRYVRVLAPKNPIVEVATFSFVPGRSRARVSTRIRLAAPQFIVAAAEMSDGSVLMASTFVDVASNGCK